VVFPHDVAGASVQPLHTVRAYHDENTQSHVVRLCPGESGKTGSRSVECLDCALLIDTEHCSVERGLRYKANDVGSLLFKTRGHR